MRLGRKLAVGVVEDTEELPTTQAPADEPATAPQPVTEHEPRAQEAVR